MTTFVVEPVTGMPEPFVDLWRALGRLPLKQRASVVLADYAAGRTGRSRRRSARRCPPSACTCTGPGSVCGICWRTRMAELKERFSLADEIGTPELWGEARRRAAAPRRGRWTGRPRRAVASSRPLSPSRCSRRLRSSRGTSPIRRRPATEPGTGHRPRHGAPRRLERALRAAGEPEWRRYRVDGFATHRVGWLRVRGRRRVSSGGRVLVRPARGAGARSQRSLSRGRSTPPSRGPAASCWSGEVGTEGSAKRRTFDDGAAYDPGSRTWRMLPPSPMSARSPFAVWTGTELIVWGSPDRTLGCATAPRTTRRPTRGAGSPTARSTSPTGLLSGRARR